MESFYRFRSFSVDKTEYPGGFMRRIAIGVVLFTMLIISAAFAFAPDGGFETASVGVPYFDDQTVYLSGMRDISIDNPAWNLFISRHGRWAGNMNIRTGAVHQIWGGSVYVGRPIDKDDALSLAISFIRDEHVLLGVMAENLNPVSSIHRLNRWIVDFAQQYNGIDVFGGHITLVISDRGNLTLYRADYFPHSEDISTSPIISADLARASAAQGVWFAGEIKYSKTDLVLFPLPVEDGFVYKLAYELELTDDQQSRWLAVVDAQNGEVLYRKDLVYYYSVDGFINGEIFESTPFDPPMSVPFGAERVQIGGVGDIYTADNGFFSAEVGDQNSRAITSALEGLYVNVNNQGGSDGSFSGTIIPGDTLMIQWDDTRSRADERNGFYHTNIIRNFIVSIDPEFTLLDFPLTCNVNLNQTCNAYWDGSSINFFRAGGGCENTGEIADVIYHEYGHGISDFQYRPYSPSGAQHEGWSDYIAATITNQPLIGRGFFGEGSHLRTVDNSNRYPEDWSGEPHNDGLIIAGALWDLREALDPRLTYCDSLFHFARYFHSTNFEDYLIDILTVDDDDDDLFNGTPNSPIIYQAFDLHGIGPGDRVEINHIPLGDTQDVTNPYTVAAEITYTLTPIDEDSLFVYYRAGGQEFNVALMQSTGNPSEYAASIPAQPWGAFIEYYISVTDNYSRDFYHPSGAPAYTHFFFVGEPEIALTDDLESETGWTIGAPGDNATSGIWERVDPIGTYSDSDPNFPYQPEDDHTLDPGINCFITGQHTPGEDNGFNDVDGGKTTLLSPIYDFSLMDLAVVEYYRWYTIRTSIDDSFFVDISSDGGTSWTNLEAVSNTENYWKRSRFLVSQYVQPTSQVQLRFVASDNPSGSLVEAGVDDFSIYSYMQTGLGDDNIEPLPAVFALKQNYPNPFNGRTEISFDLPGKSDVYLSIYDITGRQVNTEFQSGLEPGSHSIIWNGRDQGGNDVASGVYLYTLKAGDFSKTLKMLYLK